MPRSFRYCRPRGSAAETLPAFLAAKFDYFDGPRWGEQIAMGRVMVNGDVVAATYELQQQDEVCFAPPQSLEPAVDTAFTFAHTDDAVVVVNKTGNLPVAEGGRYSQNTLACLAARRLADLPLHRPEGAAYDDVPALHPAHRLDKETSGLVALARDSEAAAALAAQFAAHSAEGASTSETCCDGEASPAAASAAPAAGKVYEAVLVGELKQELDLRSPIGKVCDMPPELRPKPTARSPLEKVRMACYDGGNAKAARTVVQPLRCMGGLSFVRCTLYTGRTHQIRLHCAAAGYPVLGDKMYLAGGGSVDDDLYLARARGEVRVMVPRPGPRLDKAVESTPAEDNVSKAGEREEEADEVEVPRHLLHAVALSLVHPTTRQPLQLYCPARQVFQRECPWLPDGLFPDAPGDGPEK